MARTVIVRLNFYGNGTAGIQMEANRTYQVKSDPQSLFVQDDGNWSGGDGSTTLGGVDSCDLANFVFASVGATDLGTANHTTRGFLGEWSVTSVVGS